MMKQEVPETVSYLLVQVCRAHRIRVAERLSRFGLHPGQEMLLCQLWQEDGLTPTELADRLGVQPATVSKMLSRMDSVGLISGCRDAKDGRITRLHLTDAGAALHDPIQDIWTGVETQTLADFTLEEKLLLRRLLLQVLSNLGHSQP